MSLKDILVHVDHSRSCEKRVEAAINLARLHGAHLTGIYVVSYPELPAYVAARLGPEVIKAQKDAAAKMAVEMAEKFRDWTANSDVVTEWRSVTGDIVETLVLHSRYADVILTGQRDPQGSDLPGASDLPDQLLLRSGRPTLVVPYTGEITDMGRHILVAWDSSRLATRAINDALPLMYKADKVDVLAIDPHKHPGVEGDGDLPAVDITLHLARHGINAEAHHVASGDIGVGDTLLGFASDHGCDSIVMGGYGHRRWRELVLGGVTLHMLNHMTVPVFMTH